MSGPAHWFPRALVAVLLVAVVVLGWRAVAAGLAQRDTDAALAAARTQVGVVLSYDARTLAADQARALGATTAPFTQRFDQMLNTVVDPTARAQGTRTQARVVRAALVESRPDQVVSLLFVDQSTSTSAHPEPQPSTAQVRVTMTRVHGVWLISALLPL